MQNNNRLLTFYFDIHSQKEEIIDKSTWRPLCPFSRQTCHDPNRQIHWSSTYLQIKLQQMLNCVSTANLLTWRVRKKKKKKSVCKEVRLRFRYSLLILKSASLQWSTITISEAKAEQFPCDLKPLSMSDKVTAHIRVLCFDKCYISTSGSG